MRLRTLLVVAVLIAAVVVAVVLVIDDDDDDEPSAGEQTVTAIKPAPFTAGLAFREPPSLRSAHRRLRGTIVAKNGTIEVSGVRVHNTQSYGIAGERRGLLGPTLRVQPGDLVDLVLDNRLVAPPLVPAKTDSGAPSTSQPGHDECMHESPLEAGEPQPTNFHFHGFHVTPRNHRVGNVTYYGDNVLVCLRAGRSHIRFRIPRTHDQGTFWYHAHLHGLTDDQVYRGLAGMIVVGDSRRYLPTRFSHVRTRLLSLKDIQVTEHDDAQAIPTEHDWANPTHRTVNGLVNPKLTMRPGETQLWRVGNSSSALWYRIALLDGKRRVTFTVVSQDANPLVLPQPKTQVLLAPGNRVDVLVEAPRSGSLVLKTLPFNQGRLIFGEDVLATVNVAGPPAPDLSPPGRHGDLPTFPAQRGPQRQWIFSTYFPKNQDGQFLINGKQFDPHRVDARPRLGTTERWSLLNTSSEWHPIHIHQDDYRVISINGKRVDVRSDQDVIPLPPIDAKGVPGRVVLDMPFQQFAGNFVMHCHILDHEDAGMMARIDVRG